MTKSIKTRIWIRILSAIIVMTMVMTCCVSAYSGGKRKYTISVNNDYVIPSGLEKAVFDILDKYSAFEKSFYVLDLETWTMIAYNSGAYIRAASLVKAPFALYVCKELEKEDCEFTLDSRLAYTNKQYCEGCGKLKDLKYGSLVTVKEALELMIGISDNVGYYLLHDSFGYEGYNKMLGKYKCKTWLNGSVKWGYFTAWELANIWLQIYNYSFESETGKYLFGLFLDAEFNFINDALPQYDKVAHKSGFNEYSYGDSAIVFGDSSSLKQKPNDYIIIILSSVINKDYDENVDFVTEMSVALDNIMLDIAKTRTASH